MGLALARYAPTRHCHHCGRTQLLECRVGEAYAGLAQLMPFNHSRTQGHRPAKEAVAEAGARGAQSAAASGPQWLRRRRASASASTTASASTSADEEEAVAEVWVRETKPLRKPATGWGFADYPVALPIYGDRRAFERRLNASGLGNATADGTGRAQRSVRSVA